MTTTIHRDLLQGSDAWLQARCGLLTASEMSLILSPKTLKPAKNDKASAHLYELLAQRITGHVEPRYISDDMLRGREDEVEARLLYAKHYAPVEEVGFITRDDWGFTLGYSPDGLVGDDGLIEVKSRRQKFQAETIISGCVPDEYRIQIQTGLLVTGRRWCDFISYCGGMPMVTIRMHADTDVQAAIVNAATVFCEAMASQMAEYAAMVDGGGFVPRLIPTKRRIEQEMHL
jgi:predicted phage-related endonuclease